MAYIGAVDDAARHRRLRPDDGHGRRLERADLRAHQGRARGAARRRAPPINAGFEPRVLDAASTRTSPRSSRRRSCSSSAPARSAGSRSTLFVGLLSNLFTSIFVSKTLFELVAVAPAGRCASAQHLGHHAYLQEHRTSTSCAGAGTRSALSLVDHPRRRRRRSATQGHPARRRVRRRHRSSSSQFEQPVADRAGPRPRSSEPLRAATTPSCRTTAIRRSTRCMIRVPQVGARVGRQR